MSTSEQQNQAQSVAELSAAAIGVQRIDGNPFVTVPSDFKVHDLEKMLGAPTRKRGKVSLTDAESFCRYVSENKGTDTRLYGVLSPPKFEAIFNDHGKADAGPGWRDFGATYTCPLSIEWQTWLGSNKKVMSQEQFAQFIEDNLPDIVTPAAAEMLEISRSLEAKKKVNFASGIRLSNGENELTYEEQISGTASKGKLKVPEVFTVGIPVLQGGLKYAVKARLRYRIGEGGALAMWFDIERPHKLLEDAVREVQNLIEQKTELKVFLGG